MNKVEARRLYVLWLATSIKFHKITPKEIIDEVVDYCGLDVGTDIPPTIVPYRESIKMFQNVITMSKHIITLQLEYPDMYDELEEEFNQMNEETFIEWYRKQKKEEKDGLAKGSG